MASQFGADEEVLKYFEPEFKGICVDVGASDGVSWSNSKHLEDAGWHVVCIEPNTNYHESLAANRKVWLPYAVSDTNGEGLFHAFWGPGMNWDACSALETDPRMVELHKPMFQREETYKVPTRTLDSILEEQKLFVIDLLLVDVEGCEDKVFAGFNLKKWQPKVICVEQWEHKGQSLRPLLEDHGYTHVLRIANNDDLYVRFDW